MNQHRFILRNDQDIINHESKSSNQIFDPVEEKKDQKDKFEGVLDMVKFSKFIKKFISLSPSHMFKFLSVKQSKLINDKTFFLSNQTSDSSLLEVIGRFWRTLFPLRIRRYLEEIPVFLPQSFIVQVWQTIKIACIFICYFCHLVCFAYGRSIQELFNQPLLKGSQIILFLDILVTFNNGTYLEGVLCTNRRLLLYAYAKSRALYYDISISLMAGIYYSMRAEDQNSRITLTLLLPIIIKYHDISMALQRFQDRFLLNRRIQNILELFNLFKNILFFSHVFACTWIYVGKVSSDIDLYFSASESSITNSSDKNNWIHLMNLQEEPWMIQYIYSYYYITVTMITVGYGDIRPVNPIEIIVCIGIMMVCCVIFGFTINQIGQIFQDFFEKEKVMREKRSIIGNYMNRKNISSETQQSVFEYLQYFWMEQIDEGIEEEKKILSQLSDNLKSQVLFESNSMILSKRGILGNQFSPQLMKECISIVQEYNCTPGEVLIDSKVGNSDCSLFFVQQGELEVINIVNQTNTRSHVIHKIPKGGSFGEKSFFSGQTESFSLRSANFSVLLKIKREDFIKIAKQQNLLDYELFCMIKDQIKQSQDIQILEQKCNCCGDPSHDESTCPIIHFTPNNAQLINTNFIKSEPMSHRLSLARKRQIKQNTLFDNFEIHNTLIDFIQSYQNEIDSYEEDYCRFSYFQTNDTSSDSSVDEDDHEKEQLAKNEEIKSITEFKISQLDQDLKVNSLSFQSHDILQTTDEIPFFANPQEQKNVLVKKSEIETHQKKKLFLSPLIKLNRGTKEQSSRSNSNLIVERQKSIVLDKRSEKPPLSIQDILEKSSFQNQQAPTQFSEKQEKILQNLFDQMQFKKSSYEYELEQLKKQLQITQKKNSFYVAEANKTCEIEFDIFHGQFEKICNYKNYFPFQNVKKVLLKLRSSFKVEENQPNKYQGNNLLRQTRNAARSNLIIGSQQLNPPLNKSSLNDLRRLTYYQRIQKKLNIPVDKTTELSSLDRFQTARTLQADQKNEKENQIQSEYETQDKNKSFSSQCNIQEVSQIQLGPNISFTNRSSYPNISNYFICDPQTIDSQTQRNQQ